MKYWSVPIIRNLSYHQALEEAKERSAYITRPEWGGVHFQDRKGNYCILLRNGQILINPETIEATDAKDWMTVQIKQSAVLKIGRKGLYKD